MLNAVFFLLHSTMSRILPPAFAQLFLSKSEISPSPESYPEPQLYCKEHHAAESKQINLTDFRTPIHLTRGMYFLIFSVTICGRNISQTQLCSSGDKKEIHPPLLPIAPSLTPFIHLYCTCSSVPELNTWFKWLQSWKAVSFLIRGLFLNVMQLYQSFFQFKLVHYIINWNLLIFLKLQVLPQPYTKYLKNIIWNIYIYLNQVNKVQNRFTTFTSELLWAIKSNYSTFHKVKHTRTNICFFNYILHLLYLHHDLSRNL